jgi:hypothetical protein
MLYNFIWGAKDKVKRCTLIQDTNAGGLKMIDIESHFYTLKVVWLARIYQSMLLKWSHLPTNYINTMAEKDVLLQMNFEFGQLNCPSNLPAFYKEVIIGYCAGNNSCPITTREELLE